MATIKDTIGVVANANGGYSILVTDTRGILMITDTDYTTQAQAQNGLNEINKALGKA